MIFSGINEPNKLRCYSYTVGASTPFYCANVSEIVIPIESHHFTHKISLLRSIEVIAALESFFHHFGSNIIRKFYFSDSPIVILVHGAHDLSHGSWTEIETKNSVPFSVKSRLPYGDHETAISWTRIDLPIHMMSVFVIAIQFYLGYV